MCLDFSPMLQAYQHLHNAKCVWTKQSYFLMIPYFVKTAVWFSPNLEGISEMVWLKYRPRRKYDIYPGGLKAHLEWMDDHFSKSLKWREKVRSRDRWSHNWNPLHRGFQLSCGSHHRGQTLKGSVDLESSYLSQQNLAAVRTWLLVILLNDTGWACWKHL